MKLPCGRFGLFSHHNGRMADDLVAQLVALLVNGDHRAALLALFCGDLLHGVHDVGIKGLAVDALDGDAVDGLGAKVFRAGIFLGILVVLGGNVQLHFHAGKLGEAAHNKKKKTKKKKKKKIKKSAVFG